jgi:hypothetical protein
LDGDAFDDDFGTCSTAALAEDGSIVVAVGTLFGVGSRGCHAHTFRFVGNAWPLPAGRSVRIWLERN